MVQWRAMDHARGPVRDRYLDAEACQGEGGRLPLEAAPHEFRRLQRS